MKAYILLLLVLMPLAVATSHDAPPSVTAFDQFYGKVQNLPGGSYTLKAVVGSSEFTAAITSDGRYGYNPTFKIVASGNPTITFYAVDQLGVQTELGTVQYQGLGEGRNLDFTFSEGQLQEVLTPLPSNETTAPEEAIEEVPDLEEIVEINETTGINATGVNQTARQACVRQWECGSWGLCRNGQQTRVCYRVDDCDSATMNVTETPRPAEQQSCQEAAAATAQVCSPQSKRCFGTQLQQCSSDGTKWDILEACINGCDIIGQRCKQEAPAPAAAARKASPVWLYYLLGIAALATVVLLLAVSLLRRKQYAPAKQYLQDCRKRGISDEQIQSKLLSQGWNREKVEKLLR